MDGISKHVDSDIILDTLDKPHMLAAKFGSFFKWTRCFSFPLTKLDFVHLGVCVCGEGWVLQVDDTLKIEKYLHKYNSWY